MKTDWTGNRYCGITLDWDYEARTLDISMPGCIEKLLLIFKHGNPCNIQDVPCYKAPPKIYRKGAHGPTPDDKTKQFGIDSINVIQQVMGGVLCYTRAVDNTVLVTLRIIGPDQTTATKATEGRLLQLIDYSVSTPSVVV